MADCKPLLDFHTHILPGMDDGSRDAAQSLALLREEARQGVETVALTPHFHADEDYPGRFLDRRARALETLLYAARSDAAAPALPRLLLGAEVHYYEGISYSEAVRALALEGTELLLLEPPHRPWDRRMAEEIGSIRQRLGLVPVIAHLDRYLPLQRRPELIGELMELDVLIQVNAEGFLRRRTARWALRALEQDRLHFLGSDCHDPQRRPPDLASALLAIRKARLGPALERLLLRSERLTADACRYGGTP